jgi:hypothetical protein
MSLEQSQSYPISEISSRATEDVDDTESLPDSGTSDDIDESEDENQHESDAEREWKESLQQLELLLTMVVVPYVGKYFGRKCAYWSEFRVWSFCFLRIDRANEGLRLGEIHGMEISFG